MTLLEQVGISALGGLVMYLWTVMLVRVSGLRSLASITTFDAVMTFAVGSTLPSVVVAKDPFWTQGLAFLATLFLLQFLVSRWRLRHPSKDVFENSPMLIMYEGEFLDAALERVRLTPGDVYAKLRAADVEHVDHVRAAVLETTGDVSVVKGPSDAAIDLRLLNDVRALDGDEDQSAVAFAEKRSRQG